MASTSLQLNTDSTDEHLLEATKLHGDLCSPRYGCSRSMRCEKMADKEERSKELVVGIVAPYWSSLIVEEGTMEVFRR